MTTHRKVCKDFDPKQSISVDVSNCTVERNIFISQAYAIYNSTKPKYEVFGAMFDAGCRFSEE